MSKGMRSYVGKDKRKVRLRNHVAHDLGSPKYRQRIKEPKRRRLIDEIRQKEIEKDIEIDRTIDEEDYGTCRGDFHD